MISPNLWTKGLLATALCLAGASGASGATAQVAHQSSRQLAASMVLTRTDIGADFSVTQQAFTPTELAQQGTWTQAQLEAWGYDEGYERVFDRNLSNSNGEQIASNAGVYSTAAGANQSLIANGNECTVGQWVVLRAPRNLGDAAVFCTETASEDGYRGQLYFLVWRVGRFKGSISLSGLVDHVNAAKAIALARLQAVKM